MRTNDFRQHTKPKTWTEFSKISAKAWKLRGARFPRRNGPKYKKDVLEGVRKYHVGNETLWRMFKGQISKHWIEDYVVILGGVIKQKKARRGFSEPPDKKNWGTNPKEQRKWRWDLLISNGDLFEREGDITAVPLCFGMGGRLFMRPRAVPLILMETFTNTHGGGKPLCLNFRGVLVPDVLGERGDREWDFGRV